MSALRRSAVVARDGFELAAQSGGPKRTHVVVLLQGQANSHRWWDGLREGLEDRWRTITLDWRGTGDSRGEVGDWSTASFADDVADVLRAVAGGPAAVYGTSMGGRVAQMLALRHPELVSSLVLACTSPGGPNAPEPDAGVRRQLSEPDDAARLAALRDLFYTSDWQHDVREIRLLGDPTMTSEEARAHRRASRRHDAWDDLPRLDVPTLVLHGADDRMAPVENAHLLGERIPGAHVLVHEKGRHGFFAEFADVVTPTVRGFLRAHA
jgi:pimeloyl-ACP methyl ester carboxylesterase